MMNHASPKLTFLLSLLFLWGCNGNAPSGTGGSGGTGGSAGAETWVCEDQGRRPGADDEPCPEGQRFVKGQCMEARCDAGDLAPNCCPGTSCIANGTCVVLNSRIDTCENDGECDVGKRCLDRPQVSTETKTCGYLPVDPAGGCPQGGVPFNGRCVFSAPCGGGCPEGSVCNIDTDLCEAPPTLDAEAHGCDQVCGPSEMLVYSDPDAMLFAMCCEVTCECKTLPPLTPGVWGRYSDLAVASDALYVSAYDATYGDLVVARLNRLLGSVEWLHHVDGMPETGTVVADPNGPRGGIVDPGPDVGHYTSLALAPDGSPRTVYYDMEAQNLKYAAYNPAAGTWQVHVVDSNAGDPAAEDAGDVGRYPSLVIDPNGVPHVTYFAHKVAPAGDVITTPVYARATSATPAGMADWTRTVLDPVRNCGGACLGDQACVLEGGVPTCKPLAANVASCSCGCDEVCVDQGGVPTCMVEQVNGLDEACDGSCPSGTSCVWNDGGFSECRAPRTDQGSPCAWNGNPCSSSEICVEVAGAPTCRPSREADQCGDTCAASERCVLNDASTAAVCLASLGPAECAQTCGPTQFCVDDGSGNPTCRESQEYNDCLAVGGCNAQQGCVDNGSGSAVCLPKEAATDPCLNACGEQEVCVDDTAGPTCRAVTPYSTIEGLPKGNGLFTSLVLHQGAPTVVYYDAIRQHLRGAVANFSFDGDQSAGFTAAALACDPIFDVGRHATLAVSPFDDRLGVAYQGRGDEILHYYETTGTDLFLGTSEVVDTGVRGIELHLVGGSASLDFDADGRALLGYADQTTNDLLLAIRDSTGWRWVTATPQGQSIADEPTGLLVDGAYGSFTRVRVDQDLVFVSTYLQARDPFGREVSRLLVNTVDLDLIP